MTAPVGLLDLRIALCESRKLAEAAAGGRSGHRRRGSGKAEARGNNGCNHD